MKKLSVILIAFVLMVSGSALAQGGQGFGAGRRHCARVTSSGSQQQARQRKRDGSCGNCPYASASTSATQQQNQTQQTKQQQLKSREKK